MTHGEQATVPAPTRDQLSALLDARLAEITLLAGLLRAYGEAADYIVLAEQAHRLLAGLTLELGRLLGADDLFPVPGASLERAIAQAQRARP